MDASRVQGDLEVIAAACIKAIDEGLKRHDNDRIEWCLAFIERRISLIRAEIEG